MNEFIKAIMKTAVIVCVVAGLLLLIVGCVLLIAPQLLLHQLLHYGLIVLCLVGGVSLLAYLVRLFLSRR